MSIVEPGRGGGAYHIGIIVAGEMSRDTRLEPCISRLSGNRFRLLAIRFSVCRRTVDNIYIAYFVIMIKIIYIFI